MKTLNFKLGLAIAMLGSTTVMAQSPDTTVFGRIRRAEMSSSQIPQIAHQLTDVAGPRLTGSPGFKRAATWAVETMKKWGLTNAAMEPWGEFGKQWDLQDFSIIMKTPYIQPVMAYPNPWSSSTNGLQQGQVTLITPQQAMDTTYIAQHLADFKGKYILITGGKLKADNNFKPLASRLTDEELANMKDTYMVTHEQIAQYAGIFKSLARVDVLLKGSGALGIISAQTSNNNGTVFVQAHTQHKLSHPEAIPELTMAYEDGQKIKRLITGGQSVELAINIVAKTSTDDTKGYNVVGEIPGTDPKLKSQLVMLGGHLDSWQAATGATDNAAGCIVMMEVVRLLDSLGLKPKRTIRIALWGGEEQGVYGSYGYAQNHFMSKDYKLKPEQAKVSAYYNLDNGTGKIRGIFTQNNKTIMPIFEKWLAPFNDLGAKTVTDKNTGSTDHLSFDWAGIPGFQFIQDPIDYETKTHHSNQDNYDHLQIDDLKQAAIIVASFVYQTSIEKEMMPRKPLKKEIFAFDGL
ncbi:M20/M25/M40 family metallo-hydrolase [Mucilaginibacter conchicola]|uniref:Carboxypeptidase Q n=1 Tax=Mucilaginibacter conchicola TaxID=2303333 RepID=A0A372NVX4_9SPHI|nr:M20/M25/M40 family metallo-hydrolase [Mucilaginibacter conchicola]RFZ94074.1 M20/M25/M40 family metallo-hydrolase [Mucilaginibacter conchicola]